MVKKKLLKKIFDVEETEYGTTLWVKIQAKEELVSIGTVGGRWFVRILKCECCERIKGREHLGYYCPTHYGREQCAGDANQKKKSQST